MTESRLSRWRALWVLPPLALGLAILMFMAASKQGPVKAERGEPSRAVRVIGVERLELIPRAEGYGEVQPEKVWAAVAQVAGRVIETYPKLRNGEIVPAGTLLFRIDPVDYELQVAQSQAELAELDVQEQNNRASLAIDERNLRLAEREKQRIEQLASKGTASGSDVDAAERTMLNARAAVQNTRNNLALLPSQRRLLQARMAQAERDLANTRVHAPFDLRIADLAVEQDQYVGVGQTLFNGDAVGRVEIVAQIAMSSLRKLFDGRKEQIPDVSRMRDQLQTFTGFRPSVRMDMGNHIAKWDARFVRFSDQVDPQTRTVGVVIAVDEPLRKAIPGERPPLGKGMFVQVVIRGHAQPGRLVVPRSAVRDRKVYVMDRDRRLQVRDVVVSYSMDALSVIESGLEPGETLVISDLAPASPGMLLDPRPDDSVQQRLRDAARGRP